MKHGGTERLGPEATVYADPAARCWTSKKKKKNIRPLGLFRGLFPGHRMASHHFKSFMWLDGTHSKFRNNACERLVQDLNWELFRAEPQRTHPVTYVELRNQFRPTSNLWPDRRLNSSWTYRYCKNTLASCNHWRRRPRFNILHEMSFFNYRMWSSVRL